MNEQNHSNTFVTCYQIVLFSSVFSAGIGFFLPEPLKTWDESEKSPQRIKGRFQIQQPPDIIEKRRLQEILCYTGRILIKT